MNIEKIQIIQQNIKAIQYIKKEFNKEIELLKI